MGRPTKFSAERAERIVDAVRLGAPRHVAAAAAGVSRSTLQSWLARGETADSPATYRRFAEDLRQADAQCEVLALAHIARAATTDWRASAWLLEHARQGYGKTMEISGPEGGAIAVGGSWDLSKLSGKDLASLQRFAEKAAADGA